MAEIVQKNTAPLLPDKTKSRKQKESKFIYILLLPALLITFVFAYLPMPGIIVAFQDYKIFGGILGSPWVGLKHIINIVKLPDILEALRNTIMLSSLTLVISFPAAIILALLFNELKVGLFKKTVQTISYLPYFLSWISVIGIASSFLAIYGSINDLRILILGLDVERIMFLSKQELFVPLLIILTLWKEIGWNSIIYLAAISSIDIQLYEAAKIDGANRLQQTWHITLPSIKPTIIVLLIFSMGSLISNNFELVYGMLNPYIDFEVLSTLVYLRGIKQANYSMATAVGFVQGLVAFLLVYVSNKVAKALSEIYIW